MNNQETITLALRKQMLKKTENWLNTHVFEFLSQEVEWSELSPEKFIKVKQYKRWAAKRPPNSRGVIDSMGNYKIDFFRMSFAQAIEKNSKLVILGDPGLGKTSNLCYITRQYAKNSNKPLPIFLELKWYRNRHYSNITGNTLNRFINRSFQIRLDDFKIEQIIFFLDGFNELSIDDQYELLADVNDLLPQYPKSSWVITSRKTGYPTGLKNWTTCEINEFTDVQILHYISKVLGNEFAEDVFYKIKKQNLLDIARVPLFLRFICELVNINSNIPNNKASLLNDVVKYNYLQSFTIENKSPSKLSSGLKKFGLKSSLATIAKLAHYIYKESGKITFEETLVEKILDNDLQQSLSDLFGLFEHVRFIEKHDINDGRCTITFYSYWHQSLFDYFAGYHLRRIFRTEDPDDVLLNKVLSYFEFNKWDEPMKIFLGLCEGELSERLLSLMMEYDFYLSINFLSAITIPLSPKAKRIFTNQLNKFLSFCSISAQKALFSKLGRCCNTSIIQPLSHLLEDEKLDKSIRCNVVEAFGEIGDNQATQTLINLIKNKKTDEEIFGCAVLALGKIGNTQAVQALLKLLKIKKTKQYLRFGVIFLLGQIGNTQAVQPLISLLKDENEDIIDRCSAVSALGKIGDNQTAQTLLDMTKNVTVGLDLRKSAVEALGEIGGSQAFQSLVELLEDINMDRPIREYAANAISKTGYTQSTQYVLDLLEDKNIGKINGISLAHLLFCNGGSQVEKPLINLIENENADRVILNCSVIALGKIGNSRSVQPLLNLVEDETSEIHIRIKAVYALGEIGDTEAVPSLLELTVNETTDLVLRTIAVEALGKIGDRKTVKLLLKVLKDENNPLFLRVDIIRILGKIGNNLAVVQLLDFLENESADKYMRIQAVQSLGEIGDNRAVKPLLGLLENESALSHLGERIVRALSDIGDNRAVQPLLDLLKDESVNRSLRIGAIYALGEIGDTRAIKSLLDILEEKIGDENQDLILAALRKLINNLTEKEWHEFIIESIIKFKKNRYIDDLAFHIFDIFSVAKKRKFINIEMLKNERQLTQERVDNVEIQKEEEAIYAKMWNNLYPGGHNISHNEYRNLLIQNKKRKYEIFIDNLMIEIYYRNKKIKLPPKPRKLFTGLLQNHKQIYTYRKISQEIWGMPNTSSKSIQQAKQILTARLKETFKKFDIKDIELNKLIKDQPGEGYIFMGEVTYCVISSSNT